MAATTGDILRLLDQWIPESTALTGDPVGLQVGRADRPVNRILVALEITDAVLEEADERDVQLIVTHHPLLYGGLDRVNEEEPVGGWVARLIRRQTSVYSLHTNFDAAVPGVGDCLLAALGMDTPLTLGIHPFLRVGQYRDPVDFREFLDVVENVLSPSALRLVAPPALDLPISRVAVGPGAGGDLLGEARESGAQIYVTGEIKHHQAVLARAMGLPVIEAGHFETEWPAMAWMKDHLQMRLNALQYTVDVFLATKNSSPISGRE